MPKGPKPYKGQTRKGPSDEFSVWHDLSDPEVENDREPEDALDPDRPQGAHTTQTAGVRWFRHENIRRQ